MKYNNASLVVLALTIMVLTGCTSSTPTDTTGQTTTPVQVGQNEDDSVQVFEITSDEMVYDGPGKGDTPSDSVTTTLSLDANNIITTVTNKYVAWYPKSNQYQSAFDQAIATEIVGKPLDGLEIGTIGWASNTSKAFNKALDNIRTKMNA